MHKAPRAGRESSRWDGARRWVAFLWHLPPHKLVRRVSLEGKRRLLQLIQPRVFPDAGKLEPVSHAITPIMPPRPGKLMLEDEAFHLTFLGRSQTFVPPIPWVGPRTNRREQLWRMNLHYMEYLEACDDATCMALIEDWLAATTPYGRAYWHDIWNSYAVSLRTVVWLQQLGKRRAFPTDLKARMHASLIGQLSFLERNLETDIGGNHLIKNIKALVLGGCAYRGAAAERWRRRGLALMEDALREQISPDGMHFERSPSYHAQVFVDLLECRAALGRNPLTGRLDDVLWTMAQVITDLSHPDGGPALFNDSGLTMSYPPVQCLDALAELIGERPVRQGIFAYPQSGYFGLAHGSDVFIADCGPIGPDALPGHGHGDVLSFEWSVGGRRVIVDQGVYEYVDGARRRIARSAMSHNTLCIDGLDQAEFFSDFRVGRRPRVQVKRWQARTDGFRLEGSHDGFVRIAGEPVHTRSFDVSADVINIKDRLSRPSRGQARTALLLHPDVRVLTFGHEASLEVSDTRVHLVSSVPFTLAPAVWWPDMGHEQDTQRLIARWPMRCTEATLRLEVRRRGMESAVGVSGS